MGQYFCRSDDKLQPFAVKRMAIIGFPEERFFTAPFIPIHRASTVPHDCSAPICFAILIFLKNSQRCSECESRECVSAPFPFSALVIEPCLFSEMCIPYVFDSFFCFQNNLSYS